MNTKWKQLDEDIQELKVTKWISANVYNPSVYIFNKNSKDWGWSINLGARGRVKTEEIAKRAVEQGLIKLFREFGKVLDYDVE